MSSETVEVYRAMDEQNRERKAKNLERAESSELPWTKHTDVHWSITLQGDRLDYWPSTNKFRWRNKTRYGGVEGFIRNRSAHPTG